MPKSITVAEYGASHYSRRWRNDMSKDEYLQSAINWCQRAIDEDDLVIAKLHMETAKANIIRAISDEPIDDDGVCRDENNLR